MNEKKESLSVVDIENEDRQSLNLKQSPYLIPGSIVIAGALVAAGLFFGLQGGNTLQPLNDNLGTGIKSNATQEVTLGTNPILGDSKAELLIVEFSDFQCPFCGKFFAQTEPQILKNYVETGKARFAYRDFAFLDGFVGLERGESHMAAEAARCAHDQGKFWEYHHALFANQNGENQGGFSETNLRKFAADIGLAAGVFNTCLSEGKYREAVISDTEDAARAGVSGTPMVFIGKGKILVDPKYIQARAQAGERIIKMDSGTVAIIGALPYASIEPIIEEILKGK